MDVNVLIARKTIQNGEKKYKVVYLLTVSCPISYLVCHSFSEE